MREIALYADRSDVSEEIVRLRSHLVQFRAQLEAEDSSGRKLEFLTQEMFREANTIGSKASDTQIPPLGRVSSIEAEKGYVDVPEARAGRGEAWLVYRLTPSDMLEKESLSSPEDFQYYRARVVARVEFTYGP